MQRKLNQWTKVGNMYIPTDDSPRIPKLDPGVYNIRVSQDIGIYCVKKELKLDDLIAFDSPEMNEAIDGIDNFWTPRIQEKFKKYGYISKRGILLYGPPGTGKTSLINLISQKLINMEGVVFILNSKEELDLYIRFMTDIFRIVENNTKVITIIEDIDGYCNSSTSETHLINILDGIEQTDKIVYLATTNYPERISKRIMNRPNRFDLRIKIGFPNEDLRRKYFLSKLFKEDLDTINLDQWVYDTKQMSIAHLGEIIKSVIILENDYDETINRLRSLAQIPNSVDMEKNDEDVTSVGFKTQAQSKIKPLNESSGVGFANRKLESEWGSDHNYEEDDAMLEEAIGSDGSLQSDLNYKAEPSPSNDWLSENQTEISE